MLFEVKLGGMILPKMCCSEGDTLSIIEGASRRISLDGWRPTHTHTLAPVFCLTVYLYKMSVADSFHVASGRLVGLQLKRILRMEPTVLFWLPQSEKLL